jgi:hypothetical protein
LSLPVLINSRRLLTFFAIKPSALHAVQPMCRCLGVEPAAVVSLTGPQ